MKRSKRFITLLCSIFAMSITACGSNSNNKDDQIHDIYKTTNFYNFFINFKGLEDWNTNCVDYSIHAWDDKGNSTTWGNKGELMSGFYNDDQYYMYEYIYETNNQFDGLAFYFRINGVIKQSIDLKSSYNYKEVYYIYYTADDWVVENNVNKLNAQIFLN